MRRRWTNKEIEYLKSHFPDERTQDVAFDLGRSYSSVSTKANALGLKKSQAFKSDLERSGHINLLKYGKQSRFQPGQEAHNKGKKQEEFMSYEAIERTKRTRFKPGNLPHNTRKNGDISIRRHKNGYQYKYIRVKIGVWKLLHRVIWERHHGPIPMGHNIQFKDGNQLNCDIDNLYIISRKKQMTDNTIHRYPEEVKQLIKINSKLKKAIRHAKQTDRSE